MNIRSKIVFFTVLLAFSTLNCYSQSGTAGNDTTGIKKKNEASVKSGQENQNQNQSQGEALSNQQGKVQDKGANQGVKQVKSARPDMSKARGARPPSIVRPSGSGIPKGIGKPGGAMRRGGR